MAKQAVYDYSTTASSNSDFDGTDSSGATGKVKDGDNYARSIASHIKGFANDLGGINTVAGSGDAITITLSAAPSALVDGMRLTFNASAANTTNVTLNVTPAGGAAFGPKKVLKWAAGVETALSANDIPAANALIELIYDTARDTAAGAWMLLGTSVAAATTSASGIVELATATEAATLTDAVRAVVPTGLFFLGGYTTTATAAGTTTLTVTDNYNQYFTGSTTQTLVLPVTSTLVLGRGYRVVNLSTGAVTVQSSGANTILVLAAGAAAIFTVVLTSGTTAASWDYRLLGPGPHVIVEDQKAQNTAGGTFTSGANRTRDLNTEVYDPFGYCTVGSNQITLVAGTYCFRWSAPAVLVNRHQSLLYNVTDTAEVKRGSSEYSTSATRLSTVSSGAAVVAITASKAFEIRHVCETTAATSGFGQEGNFGTEVFTRVEITKVA